MPGDLRILLTADSHIGFDLPTRPRVRRRRRGHDFLANHAHVVEHASVAGADLVVHGGDVFHRPRVPRSVAYQAYAPLLRLADRGIPVVLVPGNHERSRLPHAQLIRHPNVYVFDEPRTFVITVRGVRLALAGFPFQRGDIRRGLPRVLALTGWESVTADARLMCMHQCAEGATVGPGDFTFTTGRDVIRTRDVPADFAAVLSGHIHRHQVLTRDLKGRPLSAPILYPGSVERTAFAEMDEPKGFMVLTLPAPDAGSPVRWTFRQLPARPMIVRQLNGDGLRPQQLDAAIRAIIRESPADAVLRIRLAGGLPEATLRAVSAAHLRAITPATMNVEVRAADGSRLMPLRHHARESQRRAPEPRNGDPAALQLEL